MRNPSYFFDAPPEHALINPDNLHILVDHVKCAAFELPFTTAEEYGRHDVQEVLGVLAGERVRAPRGGRRQAMASVWQWTNESYPADAVSLRSISSDNFVVVDTTNGADVIGETSFTSGPSTLHEKAIYLVEAALYQVEKLDFEGRKAYVRQIDCDYYTDAITYTKVTVLETFAGGSTDRDAESTDQDPPHPAHGEVHVSSRVVGLQEDQVLHQREHRFRRAGSSGAADAHDRVLADHPAGGHGGAAVCVRRSPRRRGGLSFAMRQVAQLLLMCDRQDIGISIGSGEQGEQTDLTRTGEPVTLSDEPRIFVYDNYPGGIGFSEPLFRMDAELRRARAI